MIAEVVFNLPIERAFHYLIPTSWATPLAPGVRVQAPFGAKQLIGYVVALRPTSPVKPLKLLSRLVDQAPVISEDRWQLVRWLCAYYVASLGEALATIVPTALRVAPPGGQQSGAPPDASSSKPRLSRAQRSAFEVLASALDSGKARTILLHGVTASGKTELYLQAIERVLSAGRSAICLVPEIALTPQTIDRFRERFNDHVAIWHSRLTNRQRSVEWSRVFHGECRIVVGARSAVFAPVRRLGLVILDEEHETTYKQEEVPRYHAREVAIARARIAQAVVLLGSATPSIESFHHAARGAYRLLKLAERIEGRTLPDVEIIDMREELAGRHRLSPLSRRLQHALQRTVDQGEQALLLLNRRGFSRVAQCAACGAVVRCAHCAVPLVYHASLKQLVCHYCNFHEEPPELCGMCHKGYLRFRGTGTERVESELHRLFPTTSIARMDADAMKPRESYRQLYDSVRARQVDLLVGTQMIAKGLDFPQVTLVGVVSADTALNLPDFRAGERTFDLLTQVAGRAGRGERPGRVLIQTFCPSHYAIQAARRHDYHQFFAEEIRMRRRLKLPPFAHLVELTLRGSSKTRVQDAAGAVAEQLRQGSTRRGITLLGPAPHRIPRLRRSYRVCVILKGKAVEPMADLVRETLQPGRRFRGMPVAVDVDPL